jgi:hypothetical protein
MLNEKRVLVIFHLNFLKLDRGCSHGIYVPIKMLKTLGYSIDLFCTNRFDDFTDFAEYNKENIIENLFLINTNENRHLSINTNRKINKLLYNIKKILKYFHFDKPYHFIKRKFKNKIKQNNKGHSISRTYSLDSFVTDIILEKFQEIIQTKNYNYIFIHYIEWADLFRYSIIPSETKLVYNMHDSHFIQFSFLNNIQNVTGKVLEEDLKSLNYFHSFLYNSFDEMLFWSRFFPSKKHYFFPPITPLKKLPDLKKTIDVLCLGYINPYNVEAAYWFLDEVCPLLPGNIAITFCGKFTLAIESEYLKKINEYNISTIEFVENLEELYAKTKIVIVPIQGGTGIKIKTLEALSYSIPVVTTVLGVDGFPDKFENGCLVSDNPKIFANNIIKLLQDELFYYSTQNKQNEYYKKYFSYDVNITTIKNVFGIYNEEKN